MANMQQKSAEVVTRVKKKGVTFRILERCGQDVKACLANQLAFLHNDQHEGRGSVSCRNTALGGWTSTVDDPSPLCGVRHANLSELPRRE